MKPQTLANARLVPGSVGLPVKLLGLERRPVADAEDEFGIGNAPVVLLASEQLLA